DSVSDPYTARSARKRARTIRQRLFTLGPHCSYYTAKDRSGSSPTMQGVAYLARNFEIRIHLLQRRVRRTRTRTARCPSGLEVVRYSDLAATERTKLNDRTSILLSA